MANLLPVSYTHLPVFMAVADEVGFEVKNNVEVPLGNDRNDLLKIVEAYKKGIPEDIE